MLKGTYVIVHNMISSFVRLLKFNLPANQKQKAVGSELLTSHTRGKQAITVAKLHSDL